MIRRIFSSLPSFKTLTFGPSLNVLLADKQEGATAKQTRNGAGKSSTLDIVHFLTAGECDDDSIFRLPELIEHEFGMDFDLGGTPVTVTRSGKRPNEIRFWGDVRRWNAKWQSATDGWHQLTNREWDRVLGSSMFRLDEIPAKTAFAPTFRSIFPYFARRMPGGFTFPHLHFVGGKPYQWQVAVSYLLGLDWTIPQDWQVVREKEDEIKKLRSAVGEGELAELVGNKAELRSKVASAESAVAKMKSRLETFQVLPDFRDLEREAAELAQKISAAADENTIDEALVVELEAALAEEKQPDILDLRKVYSEAGIVLPSTALRRFEDVKKFHHSVLTNRRQYLSGEITSARSRIESRERQKAVFDRRRREILEVLQSHGALDQLLRLQREFSRDSANLEVLRRRFAAAEKIEEGLTKLKIRRQELFLRLQQDYTEQKANLDRAIVYFEEVSARLYEQPSKFTPTETQNGPSFDIAYSAERSPGISNMQIYTFDMMLMQVLRERGMGPGFLIHDSHLFDPVDARQVGTALSVGLELAVRNGFQYIVTMNSDKEMELPRGFDIREYYVATRLTDAMEDGGLFGIRFG